MGGSVPMFRLGGFGHRREQQPSTAVGSSPTVGTESDSSDTLSSKSDQSWVQWIGSWIGWKQRGLLLCAFLSLFCKVKLKSKEGGEPDQYHSLCRAGHIA